MYDVPPAKNSILPEVRKSLMKSSSLKFENSDSSGGCRKSSIGAILSDPLSLWCRAQPEYGLVLTWVLCRLSTRRNNCPFMLRYCCLVGNSTGNGICSKRFLITPLGVPSALALKQATTVEFERRPGIARKNSNSGRDNSSYSHFPNMTVVIVPSFPEEKTRKHSETRVSRFSAYVKVKDLRVPFLGIFDFPERLNTLVSKTDFTDRKSVV